MNFSPVFPPLSIFLPFFSFLKKRLVSGEKVHSRSYDGCILGQFGVGGWEEYGCIFSVLNGPRLLSLQGSASSVIIRSCYSLVSAGLITAASPFFSYLLFQVCCFSKSRKNWRLSKNMSLNLLNRQPHFIYISKSWPRAKSLHLFFKLIKTNKKREKENHKVFYIHVIPCTSTNSFTCITTWD